MESHRDPFWDQSCLICIGQIHKENNVSYHRYADDTQIRIYLITPSDFGSIDVLYLNKVQNCEKIHYNFLQFNKNEEIILFGKETKREEQIEAPT